MGMSYPLKETVNDTNTTSLLKHHHHASMPKTQSLSSSSVSSSTSSAFSSTLGKSSATTAAAAATPLFDSIDRSLLPSSSTLLYDYPSSSASITKSNYEKQQQCRYFPISKHEFLPNYSSLVSDSVSPRSTSSSSTLNDVQHPHTAHHSYHPNLDLPSPSPSSNASSCASHKASAGSSNVTSTVPPLFGSPYSPSPFAPLLPNMNMTYETARHCALPSPTIFPPTPPPSAPIRELGPWNPWCGF